MIDLPMEILSHRMQSAGMRAIESAQRLRRVARALGEEMEEVTAPHGVQVTGFDEEDSLVTTIDAVISKGVAASAKR